MTFVLLFTKSSYVSSSSFDQSSIHPPTSVLRAYAEKKMMNDPTPTTYTLTRKETGHFILKHALLFLQLNNDDEKAGAIPIDKEFDPECLPVEDTNTYQEHSSDEWLEVVKEYNRKFPIVKNIPGVGIIGLKSFNVKAFDGVIKFKITNRRLSLLIHGSTEKSNCIYEKGSSYKDTSVMTLKVKIGDFEFTKKDKIQIKKSMFDLFGSNEPKYERQIINLPVLSSVNVKLKLAIDANIVKSTSDVDENGHYLWKVDKKKDINVCVPDIVAAGLSSFTIKVITFLNPFGGKFYHQSVTLQFDFFAFYTTVWHILIYKLCFSLKKNEKNQVRLI